MITAGVHGDEYNGVLAAQKQLELIGKELAGTVTVVPTINLTGMLNHSRDFYSADPDASPANLNRFSQATQTAMRPIATCLHYGTICLSQMQSLQLICTPKPVVQLTHCMCLPISVSNNRWKWLAQLTRRYLKRSGDAGVLETVWNNSGIPSITIEVGMGRYTEQALIDRTVAGIFNVLKRHEVISGEASPVIPCLEGNEIISIRAEFGGFVLPQVKMMDTVEQGQLLAIQYDSFGDEIQRYMAPTSGTVLSHNIESIRAPGSLVVRLIK